MRQGKSVNIMLNTRMRPHPLAQKLKKKKTKEMRRAETDIMKPVQGPRCHQDKAGKKMHRVIYRRTNQNMGPFRIESRYAWKKKSLG